MAKQQAQLNDRILDRRVVDRYVRKGVLSERELAKRLKDLPDVSGASELLDLDDIPSSGNGEDRRA
ncbi:MAG: hypothetical protein JXR83_23360 [Deltaproteobacteria bacterium]|nr:hypothetical protein [Deltaproteobacteria bacterium]